MDEETLTADEARRLLAYDPESGIFTRRIGTARGRAGSVAGDVDQDGYRRIGIRYKKYRCGRLAILMVTGVWPEGLVDHKNGVRSDNRFANLRVLDASGNAQNSHWRGFEKVPSGRFRARITVARKTMKIGTFDSEEEARAAYLEAKRRIHPAFEGRQIGAG